MFNISKQKNLKIDSVDSDIDVTPLLDTVFILIIFFIVTANFSQHQGIGLNSQNNDEQEKSSPNLITMVFIDSNGDIILGNNKLIKNQLSAALISKRNQCQDCIFTLNVHPKARLNSIVEVVDALRGVDIELANINLFS